MAPQFLTRFFAKRPQGQGRRRPIPIFGKSGAVPTNGIPANEPNNGPESTTPVWPNDDTNIVKIVSPDDDLSSLKAFEDPMETVTENQVTFMNLTTNTEIPPKEQDKLRDPLQVYRPEATHFSEQRTAILFKKGHYQKFDLQIGYYVQAMGLGKSADDVVFENSDYGVYCPAYNTDQITKYYDSDDTSGDPVLASYGSSLDTFWRSAENFTNNTNNGLIWAVSQAAPLRRVQAQKLSLSQGGFSSGGHLANAIVKQNLIFGTQQQFCCRNVELPESTPTAGANWNTVFVSCDHVPATSEKVVVHQAALTVEKPFLAIDESDGKSFNLHVPRPRLNSAGADLTGASDDIRSFSNVYVAKAKVADFGAIDYDVARKINKAFTQGKDVVLSPGIYHLTQTIVIPSSNRVLLGIGMATLVAPTDGTPCVQVAPKTQGVRVAGITMEASHLNTDRTGTATFLEWGQEGVTDAGVSSNPGVLNDVFCRVGGSSLDRDISTDVMIRIHCGNVLGDNLWLWRADHMALRTGIPGVPDEQPNFPPLDYHQTMLGEVPVKTGLQVYGDNVVMHGLAVEHTIEDQVQWYGKNGQVYFYQCELPYDVTQDFGGQGYLGFHVDQKVENMVLAGAGVYSNFRDYDVLVPTGMFHPSARDSPTTNGKPQQVTNLFTTHLDNQGLIQTIVDELGGPAEPGQGPTYYTP
eukprot:CAMPEP_0168740240 /NCGR_PEP_ID=MMETSP0724-20121128/11878_1 /TAXON_ID=265536 /ORGANISM="Amphiprora sp., Strain CCMP467" /LENGTH=691 /DNA_ID=CAMNT_0008787671 /DNA_START=104 /DNA_END=2179 /DNA_ORIENTATION=+